MKLSLSLFLIVLFLVGCGDKKERFVIAPGTSAAEARLGVDTIEVRDVSLPAYASASEIVLADAKGALRPAPKAIWADDPPRAVTAALARSLDVKSSATVAVEPWPLTEEPAAELSVRIEQMTARADGTFLMYGQFALSSPSGALRERLRRFSINVPMAESTPAAVATATGQAIDALADKVIAELKR